MRKRDQMKKKNKKDVNTLKEGKITHKEQKFVRFQTMLTYLLTEDERITQYL
mgnify:CR=1 FL=1